MGNIKNKFYYFVFVFSLMVCAQLSFAKPIYRCVIGAQTIYQHSPCAEIKTQKVACANYWGGLDFEDTEKANCLKNKHGESGFSYSENSSGYSESLSSIYSSGSSYSSGRAKTQRVSGYTRKDGTRVKSHMRSRKR